MSDLIDRAVLRRRVQKVATEAWKMKMTSQVETVMNQFLDFLEQAPAIETVPMRRGKWIMKDSGSWQECSVCGVAVEVDSMYVCKASEDMNFNYCPHCGAKMEV